MRAFADLYEHLDATTGTNAKVEALAHYFSEAAPEDAAWALYFLTGRRLKRFISSGLLRTWTLELTHQPEWLFKESHSAVGDTAEVCSLLLDSWRNEHRPEAGPETASGAAPASGPDLSLNAWMRERILPLGPLEEEEQRAKIVGWWSSLDQRETFILNKLLTGSFRVGVSQILVSRGLAASSGVGIAEITHRMMGDWEPTSEWYSGLIQPGETETPISRPYPFFLASPIEVAPAEMGQPEEWQAERKWDGIRAQLIRRSGETFVWSRGEELITERFPEIEQAALTLPDGTVIDGEVLAATSGEILPFSILQKRIGRKKLSKAILAEAPAILMAYDLLEENGVDIRELPMSERRARLEKVLASASGSFRISPLVPFESWPGLAHERDKSRDMGVEGIMLKRASSTYQSGRRRGDWWKWKIDPLTVDAVLIYAQAGSGRRASLFTDYTFAVWDKEILVPIAKAYSGLTDEEIGKLDNWIRRHTKEKFGPVRSVEPAHVFEIAFEGIASSPRHRSGVALRFPRILRWRHDKKITDADNISMLKAMIDGTESTLPKTGEASSAASASTSSR